MFFQGLYNCLSRQHSRFHGRVNAFQSRHIVDRGTTAGQQPAVERQLRHTEIAASGNGSGALFHDLAPLYNIGYKRMLFKLNEGVTYVQMRVLIGEPH